MRHIDPHILTCPSRKFSVQREIYKNAHHVRLRPQTKAERKSTKDQTVWTGNPIDTAWPLLALLVLAPCDFRQGLGGKLFHIWKHLAWKAVRNLTCQFGLLLSEKGFSDLRLLLFLCLSADTLSETKSASGSASCSPLFCFLWGRLIRLQVRSPFNCICAGGAAAFGIPFTHYYLTNK